MITVDAHSTGATSGAASLSSSQSYLLVASGLYWDPAGDIFDPLYCVSSCPQGGTGHFRDPELQISTHSALDYNYEEPIDYFQQPGPNPHPDCNYYGVACPGGPPYNPDHVYVLPRFYPPTNGPLTAGTISQLYDPPSGGGAGGFTIRIYRPNTPLLILGLGDSLSSGEGNPDVAAHGQRQARWENEQCDRSNRSYQAQVVSRLRRLGSGRPIQFEYIACSGASMLRGLLGPYPGINSGPYLNAQVGVARSLTGGVHADAVMLSAGVNDLEFGSVAKFCASTRADAYCPGEVYRERMTLSEWVGNALADLPRRYDKLAKELNHVVDPGNVFIMQYPDLLSDGPGRLCSTIYFRPGVISGSYEIKPAEVRWLYHNFYLPLNAAVTAAAAAHGWRVISPPASFENHGYCASDHWIVRYSESEERQGNGNGTLHPNFQGQTQLADVAFPIVRDALGLYAAPAPPPAG